MRAASLADIDPHQDAALHRYSSSKKAKKTNITQSANPSSIAFTIELQVNGTCAANALSSDPVHLKFDHHLSLSVCQFGGQPADGFLRGETADRLGNLSMPSGEMSPTYGRSGANV